MSGTATHYYLADGLGSVMALTNSGGAVVNTYDYDVKSPNTLASDPRTSAE